MAGYINVKHTEEKIDVSTNDFDDGVDINIGKDAIMLELDQAITLNEKLSAYLQARSLKQTA